MTMGSAADPFPAFSQALADTLRNSLKPITSRFLDMVADDVVMEFPYAPPDGTSQVAGRDALTAYVNDVARRVTVDRIAVEAVHRTSDPDVTILEFRGEGRFLSTGARYDQRYISVIRVRDGRISHYRDYWNPLALEGATEVSA